MAELSTQVSNREKWARFVLASLLVHGVEVEEILEALYDGRRGFDGGHIGPFFDALADRLEEQTDDMTGAEERLAVELSDDPQVRGERDGLIKELREENGDARTLVERAFGPEAKEAYGLAEPPPRQPDSLLSYTRNVISQMRAEPRTVTDRFGNVFETDDIADELEQSADELEEALEAVDTERRETHTARAERDEVVDEWTRVYRGTATVLSGLYTLAGRDDLAERVRPTVRQSTGKADPPEDPEGAMEEIGDGADDEAGEADEEASLEGDLAEV